jgi:Uncharacterized protein conserved in bacteria
MTTISCILPHMVSLAALERISFLLTYESQLDMNKLEDLMSLGKYRNHQVDMLTLSACQTALGNERTALGLAGVAVKPGKKCSGNALVCE